MTRLNNQFVIARLSLRYPRFARAIAARRFFEIAYTLFPRLTHTFPGLHPSEVVIALTSRCQLKCSMCGIRRVMARPEFSKREIYTGHLIPLLDEIARWRLKPYIEFTGGEPLLLQHDLLDLVRECHYRTIPTRVSTNGCLAETN